MNKSRNRINLNGGRSYSDNMVMIQIPQAEPEVYCC